MGATQGGNPFKDWKRKTHLSYPQIAERCAAFGRETSSEWIKQIANGIRRSGWDLAVVLSKVTGDAVPPEDIMRLYRGEAAS